MPIVFAPIGTELRVIKTVTDEKTKRHLESLGITINAKMKVLSSCGGNVICLVKEGRLALDKEIALKIFVA